MMLQGCDAVKSRSTGRGGGKEVVVEKEGKILTALLRVKSGCLQGICTN
jgi:hypothetical protein